jgi:hypothetical protein
VNETDTSAVPDRVIDRLVLPKPPSGTAAGLSRLLHEISNACVFEAAIVMDDTILMVKILAFAEVD